MNRDDIEISLTETLYDGYLRVDRHHLRHRRHDGAWCEVMTREIVERGHAVAVLPYDPTRDEVVLIEQFRIGALTAGVAPWQIEIIAGIIEPGESLETVARRESLEEAGCEIGEMIPACRFLTSPGVLSETVAIYIARTDATGIGGVHGVAEEGEDIRAFTVGFDDAMAMLDEGRIDNSPAIAGLLWLARHRVSLRARWLGEIESGSGGPDTPGRRS